MALLVDSVFYIQQQKAGVDIWHQLVPFLQSGELYGCGIVRVEVLRGIRNPSLKRDLEDFFDILPEIPTDISLWREATDLAWSLDRKGHVLPLTDLVIGCCALRVDAVLITVDSHFRNIPRLKVRATLPPR